MIPQLGGTLPQVLAGQRFEVRPSDGLPVQPTDSHCPNDECREYRKTGRRRYVGVLLPGCKAQCRSCGTWVRG